MGAPEVFLVCQGCLSDDRRCNVIDGNDLNVFLRILDPDGGSKDGRQDINCLFLCWECDATLRKIKTFQNKVQKARKVLKKLFIPNLKIQCLSTLKTITKTKYDAYINTSLQFKDITIFKIGENGQKISDDLFKNNEDFDNSTAKEYEFEVTLTDNPKNYYSSGNDYDMNDSDPDDKPIIELKEKKSKNIKSIKQSLKKKFKKEDRYLPPPFDPLAGRPKRLKKPVEKLVSDPINKYVQKKYRGRPKKIELKKVLPLPYSKKEIKLPKGTLSRPVKVIEPPSKDVGKKWVCVDPSDSEENNSAEDNQDTQESIDPSFVTSAKIKPNHHDENSKYTKVKINMADILQYFTKYTLSVVEYKNFLEKLSKSPYFMSIRKKCVKCVVTFLEEEDYDKHMKLHDSNSGHFTCNLCDLHFADKPQQHAHARAHLTVQQCNICKQSCGLQHSLSTHMNTVHREGLVFRCRGCTMVFESRSAVCQHYDKLHKRLVCNECGKFQYSKKTMAMHFLSKHVPPVCPHCQKVLKNYTYLRTHLILRHNYPEKKKCKMEDMYCVECDKQFNSMLKFRTHTATVHRPDKTIVRVECKECGKMISKNFLKTHHDFYHGVPRFKCEICNRPFAKKESMQRHVGVFHLGQRPVKDKPCYICGRLFTTNRILTHHIRTHTGEKPFSCDYCPATFAQKAAKYIHYKNVHKRRLDNTTVDNDPRLGHNDPRLDNNDPRLSNNDPRLSHNDPRLSNNDPRLGVMGQMGPVDAFMDMGLVRAPVSDCSVSICHSVLTGDGP